MGDREIEYAIQKLAGTFKTDVVGLMVGTIKSVDEGKATCVVVIQNDVELPNVQLQSAICDGLLIIPEVDSTVTVISSKHNVPFIAQFSDIKKYYLQVGDSSITVWDKGQNDGEQIVFNDGSFKGLVKVEELVKKLNALEDDLNDLKTLWTGVLGTVINEPGNGSPSAFQTAVKGAMQSYNSSKFTDTKRQDIENETVTHGK